MLGLFYLTRYNALVFLPFLALFRAYQCPGKRAVAVLRVLAGFLLATLPWLIRNTIIFGNPFFSLQKYEIAMFTKTYPDYLMYGLPEKVDALGFAWQHIQEIGDKIAQDVYKRQILYQLQEQLGDEPLFVVTQNYDYEIQVNINEKADFSKVTAGESRGLISYFTLHLDSIYVPDSIDAGNIELESSKDGSNGFISGTVNIGKAIGTIFTGFQFNVRCV